MSRPSISNQKAELQPPQSAIPSTAIDRILRVSDVTSATGLGRNTIYRWMNEGLFPLPIDLGGCRVGWRQSDIKAWIESRPLVRSVRLSRNVTPWQTREIRVGK